MSPKLVEFIGQNGRPSHLNVSSVVSVHALDAREDQPNGATRINYLVDGTLLKATVLEPEAEVIRKIKAA
jgi:hypothetical protein